MNATMRWTGLAVALFATLSCAAATGEKAGKAGPEARKREIAFLDKAIGKENDAAVLAGLLFKRGHVYLEEAEFVRDLQVKAGKARPEGVEFATLLLGALRDFEDIVANFPQSAEAPEALFHLGIIYDYPNLSNFGLALNYYRRTIEKYPGTESARKARIAIDNLERIMHAVETGRHGVQ
jgi:hypothetical protein